MVEATYEKGKTQNQKIRFVRLGTSLFRRCLHEFTVFKLMCFDFDLLFFDEDH